MRSYLYTIAHQLARKLKSSLSFHIHFYPIFSLFKSCVRSCRVRNIDPWLPLQAFRSLLEVQISAGQDYYLCAPPGLIFPSDLQQSPSSTLQPAQTDCHITVPSDTSPSQAPTESVTQPAAQGQEELLATFSPATLATPQVIPEVKNLANHMPNELTFKPLGTVGSHTIPEDILQQLLPEHNDQVKPNQELEPFQLPSPYPFSQAMQDLITSLPPDVLTQVPPEDYKSLAPLYHAAAFLMPKPGSNKISLILHMRAWNHSQHHKPPPFKLPTIYSLRMKLLRAALAGHKLWFTTWDLKNFYWALKGPIIRFATVSNTHKLQVWRLNCVPFGWDKACYLGQTVHRVLKDQIPLPPAPATDAVIYIDDGLGSGTGQKSLTQYTKDITNHLDKSGFPISEKSNLEAAETQKYIGKQYSSGQIANTQERLNKILMLFVISACAPYLSHTFLEKLLGVCIYAVSHTNGYSHTAYLRWLTAHPGYKGANSHFRNSLASIWGQAATPWQLQGFFALSVPNSPRVYVDAGPHLVGLVFQLQGTWHHLSVELPPKYKKGKPHQRQQQSELFGVLAAIRHCLAYKIKEPTFVLDSTSAFGSCLKGSTGIQHWGRIQLLQHICAIVTRTRFRAYLNLINTKYHPGDLPSRVCYTLSKVPQVTTELLKHIDSHPALVATEPTPFVQDTTRNAWTTPDWIRWLIRKSPHPPTFDLFADSTSALTIHHFSQANPFHPSILDTTHTCFYQPPYKLLDTTWKQCASHLPTTTGLWGLVPSKFFTEVILAPHSLHICSRAWQVNYSHPNLPGDRANFTSTLFFVPPQRKSTPHTGTCQCNYLAMHY